MPISTPPPAERRREESAFPPRTSLPVWPAVIPTLDQRGTAWTIFALGLADPQIVTPWLDDLRARAVSHEIVTVPAGDLERWIPVAMDQVHALAARHVVGWRIALAGEEFAVLAVQAAAIDAGLLESELTAFVTSRERFVVACAHCGTKTIARRSDRGPIACLECGTALAVHDHLSRRLGGYLGTAAEADR